MIRENESNAPTNPTNNLENKLKVRDDDLFFFIKDNSTEKFRPIDSDANIFPVWLSDREEFSIFDLRKVIEPWLTALFQSEHLSLLVGSGLTQGIHQIATGENATGMSAFQFNSYKNEIAIVSDMVAKKANRGEKGNFEDCIRVANNLLRGLEILAFSEKEDSFEFDIGSTYLEQEIKNALSEFAKSILSNEKDIVHACDMDKREKAMNTLVSFLMSFASRTGTRDRLNIFTTNYDRLIEEGAELAGLYLIDRFVGTITPIFRSSRLNLDMHYNPPGIRGEPRYLEGVVRFTKLHGSVDWIQTGSDIRRIGLPFGTTEIQPFLKVPGLNGSIEFDLMIYPNSAKDRETSEYPYVELFRDFAAAICRPNNTLVTYGYGFGDEHINRIITDMLTIPSTHLVVISWSDPYKRIIKQYYARKSQVSLLIGPDLANLESLTNNFLPKAAIDKATIRMGEILQRRYGIEDHTRQNKDNDPTDNDGEKQ